MYFIYEVTCVLIWTKVKSKIEDFVTPVNAVYFLCTVAPISMAAGELI